MTPIAVIVQFENRKTVPLKFRHSGTIYDIANIIDQKPGKNVWNNNPNQIYTVDIRGGGTAVLEWVVDTGEWLLTKMPTD